MLTKFQIPFFVAVMTATSVSAADIPAPPVLTLYDFNGPVDVPLIEITESGLKRQAGHLSQGSSVAPCLVIQDGGPLTDSDGTPLVGFQVVVDSGAAGPSATVDFERATERQNALTVHNHHCTATPRFVLDVRNLYPLKKAPWFDPPADPASQREPSENPSTLAGLIREFHDSPECATVDSVLLGRRARLSGAWESFIKRSLEKDDDRLTRDRLERAKQLDYAVRTALFEGHFERGCSSYGACERNLIVLTLRNRSIGQCLSRQGCKFPGDIQGVSSEPSQYNIWDEYLTQISGLTSCFLRPDLASISRYRRLQGMFNQTVDDAQTILFGDDADLLNLFPNTALTDLTQLRHYYHPPAMGKCFPNDPGVEYITGAIAKKNSNFALIANTRIQVGTKRTFGYEFKDFQFEQTDAGDAVTIKDLYPGFLIDERKVTLRKPTSCTPYGVSSSCRFMQPARFRKTPSWLTAGQPVAVGCHVTDFGKNCSNSSAKNLTTTTVGGPCDTEMMPVSRVR